jgi:hypothetical protein
MNKKKIIRLVIILAFIAILVSVMPLPVKINKTLSGIEWKDGDSTYFESVDIRINGTFKRYLFRNDIFKGHVTISNNKLTYTTNARLFDSEFFDINNIQTGWLTYYSSIYHNFISIGSLSISGAFDRVLFHINDNQGKRTDCYISAPATDRQSAFNIAYELNYAVLYGLS